MTELEILQTEVKALGTKMAELAELVETHISETNIEKVKLEAVEPKTTAGGEYWWVDDLDQLWAAYRAEKDPQKRRELYDQIQKLQAIVDAIKKPGAGVVKPPSRQV